MTINEGWAGTQQEMAMAFQSGGAHASLSVGEAFASSLHPMRVEGFRLRDIVFRHLATHRRQHGISLDSHVVWSRTASIRDAHPVRVADRQTADLKAASSKEERARIMASRGKVLFSMGYVDEAEKQYHEALLIDECTAARLGKAAVLRHRMYSTPKGHARNHLWEDAVELVEEVLVIEEDNSIAMELMDSLKGDSRWL